MTDPTTFQPAKSGPGTVVGGRYVLHAALGNGGMGTVWHANDTQLGREVAVKEVVPPPGVTGEERDSMYERMLREARAAASIVHPSVVQVYDVVTDGGRPWVVMELLDARSLADIILSDGTLAPRAVAKIGIALLGALEMAHAAGILHRDVKPGNVLVCADGRCVLTDFGVARLPTEQGLTTPGMVLGSPHFISPERALGASFGPPSDLFSLGVTLYTAVEGRAPFDRGDPIATMHAVVEDAPAEPERAGPLTRVLNGLMEKDPERRYDAATARNQLRQLIAGPLASRSVHHPTDPQAVVPPRWSTPAPAANSGSQIGGRALLPSGDDDPYRAVPDAYTSVPDPYRTAAPAASPTAQRWSADTAGHPQGETAGRTAGPAERYGGPGRRRQVQGDRRASRGPDTAALAARGREGLVAFSGQVATAARQLTAAAQRLPRRTKLVAAAGVAAVTVAGLVVVAVSGGGDPTEEPPGGAAGSGGPPSAGPEQQALIPVQQFAERGIVVNLPKEWREVDRSGIRVDFADPADDTARLRLLQEESGADAIRFIEIIEPNITCDDPYERVELSEIELGGLPAARLEYTCGSGADARHSLWATVVRDETAYSFFLSVRAEQFEQRRVIFDELVRSFRFAE